MYTVKLVSAYSIIAVFAISFVILLLIITHLCTKLAQKRNYKNKNKRNAFQFFLLITIVAVIFFELTLILVIAVTVQIILIDAHKLHEDSVWIAHLYFESFEYMEYLIAIFDTLGHLFVVLVFIARFQVIFQANSIFNTQGRLIRILYSCLGALFIVAVVIIILICIEHTVAEIIIIEIIWEILVDFMCLWILYLFISNLYLLLKLSLQAHMKSDSKQDFLKQLIEATKLSITESKSEQSDSGNKSKNKKKSKKSTRAYTMTIDGIKTDPLSPSPKNSRDPSPNPSPDPPPNPSPDQSPDPTEYKSNCHTELTVTAMTTATAQQTEQRPASDNEHNEETNTAQTATPGEPVTIDLIGVMTKTTVLVIFAVIVSVFGVVGNVFIEYEEIQNIEKHDIAMEELWADVLPVIDVVVTSLMLYLQFNFTHRIYRFLLGRLDVWFLTQCLKFVECCWERQFNENDEKTASFLVTDSTKTLEIRTISEQKAFG